ncbi:ProQ/FINO family protein [Chromatium okenii]
MGQFRCQRIAYLKAMRIGTARIDLQGQPAGEVTEAAAIIARDELVRNRMIIFRNAATHYF